MDRLCPPRKDIAISSEMPPVESATEAVNAMAFVLLALANGNITPSEAQAVAGIIETFRRTIETGELEMLIPDVERAN